MGEGQWRWFPSVVVGICTWGGRRRCRWTRGCLIMALVCCAPVIVPLAFLCSPLCVVAMCFLCARRQKSQLSWEARVLGDNDYAAPAVLARWIVGKAVSPEAMEAERRLLLHRYLEEQIGLVAGALDEKRDVN